MDLKEALDSNVDIVCEDSIDEDFTKTILSEGKLVYEL